jgi:hypothetical protein
MWLPYSWRVHESERIWDGQFLALLMVDYWNLSFWRYTSDMRAILCFPSPDMSNFYSPLALSLIRVLGSSRVFLRDLYL